MFKDILQSLKELVFPDNCFLCRSFLNSRHQRQLCPSCLATIKENRPPFCALCSRHLTDFSADGLCGSCKGTSPHYDRIWGVCAYNEPMRKLLHAFKYNGKTGLRKTFLPLISSFITTFHLPLEQFDLVCPIPLHPVRLRERGYNQALLLSHGLCQYHHLKHAPEILIRQSMTDSQTHLDRKQRWTNLDSAFKIKSSDSVGDKSILLIDDLFTTGATIEAAAKAFKEAGAAYVAALTLAITE